MAEVVLITGGNIGDVQAALNSCNRMLEEQVGSLKKRSSVVESRAWGYESSNSFLNQVLILNTQLSPLDLLRATQHIERELGRETKSTDGVYHDRTIDIDILFYDDLVVSTAELTIPHPHLQEREFVLAPLCEVAQEKKHPVIGTTVGEIYKRLKIKAL